jgi:hypothetical protein
MRLWIAVILTYGIVVTSAVPAWAGFNVFVNGSYLNLAQPPVERGGRVFVPMRAIFEELGASVVYNNGVINASGSGHSVQLTIGSRQALVDGRPTTLDSEPFLYAGTTMVPIRFVSEALGADVAYDQLSQSIAITSPNARPQPTPAGKVTLNNLRPASGSTVNTARPELFADFMQPVNASSVHVTIDGRDVTSFSRKDAYGFRVTPNHDLNNGKRLVAVTGSSQAGSSFNQGWSFYVASGPAVTLSDLRPADGSTVTESRPSISARFSQPVTATSVRIAIDGRDVTASAARASTNFSVVPNFDLSVGSHAVSVNGQAGGRPFSGGWSFTRNAGAMQNFVTIDSPRPNTTVPPNGFTVSGSTLGLASVRISVRGSGVSIDGQTTASTNGSFSYQVRGQLPLNAAITVQATSTRLVSRPASASTSVKVMGGQPR